MNREIERKFLLEGALPDLSAAPCQVIRQGYLAVEEGREVRLRQLDTLFFLTVKTGKGLERGEVEIALMAPQFHALWPLTEGRRVEKRRYRLEWAGFLLEIDRFEGRHAPLCLAEVEFPDLETALRFVKPPFLGTEVTGAREFTNAWLATRSPEP